MAHELYRNNIFPLIPRIMSEWAHSRTGMGLTSGRENRIAFSYRITEPARSFGETSEIG